MDVDKSLSDHQRPHPTSSPILCSVWEKWEMTPLPPCVGQAIVQGDESPVGEVAQGVQVHGVVVRHGEKQEKEEGEVEQEVEGDGEKTLKDEDTCAWMG